MATVTVDSMQFVYISVKKFLNAWMTENTGLENDGRSLCTACLQHQKNLEKLYTAFNFRFCLPRGLHNLW